MNLNRLLTAFRVSYDLGTLGLPGLEDEEIREILHQEQYKLINQRLQGNNIYRTKFPDNQKRINDLNLLIKTTDLSLSASNENINEYICAIPSDFLYIYLVKIIGNDGVYDIAEEVPVVNSSRFIDSYRNNNPAIRGPKFIQTSSSIGTRILKVFYYSASDKELYNPGLEPTPVRLTYLRKPTDLTTVNGATTITDFNDDVYYEIVRAAVDNIISILAPERSQVNQIQTQKTE